MTKVFKSEEFASKSRHASVTVLIPCYNYGRFLKQCVASVLTQTGVDVKVVVMDDASTDDSASIAAAIAREDERVRLISLSKNHGMIPAVNLGLREIAGDYFVKLDADDMLSPGSLSRSVSLLETFPNVGFVYGWPRHFSGHQPMFKSTGYRRWTAGATAEWLAIRGCRPWTLWQGSEWLELRYRRAANCIRQPEAVIRSSTLKTVGEYNVALPHTSDLEMWLRLAVVSDVGRVNGWDQGYYRIHADSMQRTVNAGIIKDLVGRREAFLNVVPVARERQPANVDLEGLVRKKLAVEAVEGICDAFDRGYVHAVPIDGLKEFAVSTYPDVVNLPIWRGMERRRQRKRHRGWRVASIVASSLRRTRSTIAYFRWVRSGV